MERAITTARTTYRDLNLPTMRKLRQSLRRAQREGTLDTVWVSWASKWHQVIYNMIQLLATQRTWLNRSRPIIEEYRPPKYDQGIHPGHGVGYCGEPIYIIDGWADHCIWFRHQCDRRSLVFYRSTGLWCVTCNQEVTSSELQD